MTYKEFITGLYLIFHYVPNASRLFIPAKKVQTENTFQDFVVLKVDAEIMLKQIKNLNKRASLIYKAIGYYNWEIAIKLRTSERTINNYIKSIKIFLRKVSK